MKVCAFLTSAAVDLVRRGGTDLTHVAPLDPLMQLMTDFMARGGTIYACTPCARVPDTTRCLRKSATAWTPSDRA